MPHNRKSLKKALFPRKTFTNFNYIEEIYNIPEKAPIFNHNQEILTSLMSELFKKKSIVRKFSKNPVKVKELANFFILCHSH